MLLCRRPTSSTSFTKSSGHAWFPNYRGTLSSCCMILKWCESTTLPVHAKCGPSRSQLSRSRASGTILYRLRSKQGQVAAARSASSSHQLLHGRTADGKLAIVGGAAVGSSNGSSSSSSSSQQKGGPRIQGLKMPSSWREVEEVPRGSYIFGQDGRVQQYEFFMEAGNEDEVRGAERVKEGMQLRTSCRRFLPDQNAGGIWNAAFKAGCLLPCAGLPAIQTGGPTAAKYDGQHSNY